MAAGALHIFRGHYTSSGGITHFAGALHVSRGHYTFCGGITPFVNSHESILRETSYFERGNLAMQDVSKSFVLRNWG